MAIQWVDPYLNTLSGGGNGTTGSGSGTYASPYTLRQAFSDNTVFNSFSDGDEIRLKGLSESTFFPTQTTYDLTSAYANTYNDGTYDYHRRFVPNDSAYKQGNGNIIEFYRMRTKFSNKIIYGWTNTQGQFCTLWNTDYRHPLYGQLDETYGAYKFDVTNYGLKQESDGNPIFWTSSQGNGYVLYDLTVPNLYITSGWDSETTQNGVTVLVNTDTYYAQGSNTSSAALSGSSRLNFGRNSATISNTTAEWITFDSSNYNTLIWGLRDSIQQYWYVNNFHAKAYCTAYNSSSSLIYCGKQYNSTSTSSSDYWHNRKQQQGNCTIGVSTHGYAPGIRLSCGVNSSTKNAEDMLYKVDYLSYYDHNQNQVRDLYTSGTDSVNTYTFTYDVTEQYSYQSIYMFYDEIYSNQPGPKTFKIQYNTGYNWETRNRYFDSLRATRLPNMNNPSTYYTHLDLTGERTVTRLQRSFPPAAGQTTIYRWYEDEANWGMQNQSDGLSSLGNGVNGVEGINPSNWEGKLYSEYFWTKKTWTMTEFFYRDRAFVYNWSQGSYDWKTYDKFPIAFSDSGRQFDANNASTVGRTGDLVLWAADGQNPIRILPPNSDDSGFNATDRDYVGAGFAEFNDSDNSNKKTWLLYRSWVINNITKYINDYHWFSLPDWSSSNLTFAASFSAANSNNISLRLRFYVYSTSTKKFELLRTVTPTASNNAWSISETFTTADLTSANAIAYGDMIVAIGAYPLNNTTTNEKLVWESQPTLT